MGGRALSLSFVTLYVGPVLRVTGRAFEGLERAAHEMAKKERLEKELEIGARAKAKLPIERICNEIHDSVFAWCNQAADDVTLLIVRYGG